MVLRNLLTGQQWRNRHREQTYRHGERGGEGEMYGKSNMETYPKEKKTKKHTLILQNILEYLNVICCLLFWDMILTSCLYSLRLIFSQICKKIGKIIPIMRFIVCLYKLEKIKWLSIVTGILRRSIEILMTL